jgi:hypothetical protein
MLNQALKRKALAHSLPRAAVDAAAGGRLKEPLLRLRFPMRLLRVDPKRTAIQRLRFQQRPRTRRKLPKLQRLQPFPHLLHVKPAPAVIRAITAIHAIEVAMAVAAREGLVAEIANNSLRSRICYAKDRKYSFRLPKSRSPKKVHASLRILPCPAVF